MDINWKPLQEADKEYLRCTRHYHRDPLAAEAAVRPDGSIVGVLWNTTKGVYLQTMFDNRSNVQKKYDPDCIQGPFNLVDDAKAALLKDWQSQPVSA